jgi:hypothetical protein
LWWKVLVEGTDNALNTACGVELSPAGGTVFGVENIAATGSIIVGNVEIHTNKTIAQVRGLGPIFTTTAAVATVKTAYSWLGGNVPVTNAAHYFEWNVSAVSDAMYEAYWGTGRYYTGSSDGLTLTNLTPGGGGSPALFIAFSADTLVKDAAVYSSTDGLATVNRNATYSNQTAWVAMNAATIYQLDRLDPAQAGKFRNIRIYATTGFTDGKTIIDGLMV